MLIFGSNRMSRLSACLEAAHHFLLSEKIGAASATKPISQRSFAPCCGWGRQFLNPFAFEDIAHEYAEFAKVAGDVRKHFQNNA